MEGREGRQGRCSQPRRPGKLGCSFGPFSENGAGGDPQGCSLTYHRGPSTPSVAAFPWCSPTDPSEVTRVLSLAWPQGRAFTLAWTLSPAPLGSASQLLHVGLTALSHQSKAQSLLADRSSPP